MSKKKNDKKVEELIDETILNIRQDRDRASALLEGIVDLITKTSIACDV